MALRVPAKQPLRENCRNAFRNHSAITPQINSPTKVSGPEKNLPGRRLSVNDSLMAFTGRSPRNDLIIEHIVEEQSWADDLIRLLSPFDVFWVGVHAPVEELDRREEARGNRRPGEARFHLKAHRYVQYDVEVDSTQPLDSVLERIILAWRARPGANIS
jgi:chloramphenicol 3-O-phosphotransferase